jgi:hypothetical protein
MGHHCCKTHHYEERRHGRGYREPMIHHNQMITPPHMNPVVYNEHEYRGGHHGGYRRGHH